jgi:hypothetical protein
MLQYNMQMPSMYKQNAINTYVKYVSIKMLYTCNAFQFVAIVCHTMHINKMLQTNMYQENAKNTYAKYVSIKMLHNWHAMQFIAIYAI